MPFKLGIIKVDQAYKLKPPEPRYLMENSDYEISCLLKEENKKEITELNVDILKPNWPHQKKLLVNSKQLQALKLALTSELALIQGPPGTGKTFIALEIVKVLLHNERKWRPNPKGNAPIVLICFTNHALDEMMRKLLDDKICIKDDMVRLGRRCNEEKLDGILIHELREKWFLQGRRYNKEVVQQSNEISSEIYSRKTILKKLIVKQETIRNGMPTLDQLFDHDLPLKKKMTDVINKNLASGGWKKVTRQTSFQQWLNPNDQYFKKIPLPRHFSKHAEEGESLDAKIDDEKDNEIEFSPFWKMKLKHWRPKNVSVDNQMKLNSAEQAYFNSLNNKTVDEVARIFAKNNNQRLKYFAFMRKKAIQSIQSEIDGIAWKVNDLHAKNRQLRVKKDVEICREKLILGMTSTAAARCSDLLKDLGSKIIICEEASEVLESHTIASLTKACEHFIMIGDHQQLRPKPANDSFAKSKHLDIPLFERLISNGFKSVRLDDQRRMRPEISLYPRNVFYKGMTDNNCVKLQARPTSLEQNVYFMNYNNGRPRDNMIREEQPQHSNSKINRVEAEFAVQLAWFFIRSGYKSSQITILTYYGAQLRILRECRDKLKRPSDSFFDTKIEVKTVDNFQGQENEIIILSTVRANSKNEVGFTSNKNRTNVALSRAKQCMIVMGDFEMLSRAKKNNNCWKDIYNVAEKNRHFTNGFLSIGCAKHSDYKKIIDITQPELFMKHFPKGGCQKKCKGKLKCGHKCTWNCHDEKYHEVDNIIKCEKPCDRKCIRGHQTCKQKCFEPCTSCSTLINREDSDIAPRELARCTHTDKVPCGSGFFWRCPVIVKKQLPCGHEDDFKCGASPYELRCKLPNCSWFNKVSLASPHLETIRVAENLVTANFMATEILKNIDTFNINFVGFDMEWVQNNRTGLIQVSYYSSIGFQTILFRTAKFELERCDPLMTLLKSREIVKLGVCVKGDLERVAEETDFDIANGAYLELGYLYDVYSDMVRVKASGGRRLQSYAETVLQRKMEWKSDEIAASNWDAKSLNSIQVKYAADDALVAIQLLAVYCSVLGDEKVYQVVNEHSSTDHVLRPKKKKEPKKEDYEEDDMLQQQMENLSLEEYNRTWFEHEGMKEFRPPTLDLINYAETEEDATEMATTILEYISTYKVPFVGMDAEWLNDNPICLIQITAFDEESESGFSNFLFRSSKFNMTKCKPLMDLLTSDQGLQIELNDIFKIGVEVDSDLKRLAYEKPPESLDIEHGAFLDLYSLTLGQGDRTPGLKRLAKDYCGRELDKTCQVSDWEATLTTEMKLYAADDSLSAMQFSNPFYQILASLFQKEGYDSIMAQANQYKNSCFSPRRQRQTSIDRKLKDARKMVEQNQA